MLRRLSIFLLIFLISLSSVSAQNDSVVEQKKHNPKRATLYSAVLPGLGQAYNKKYWKIPVVYAGIGTIFYFAHTNGSEYRTYRDAFDYKNGTKTNVNAETKELADKYEVSVLTMTGFLDGINDSLVNANPIEEMEEDTEVNLVFDKTSLYKNMVAAEADWLYNLEEWNGIFDEATRKVLYKQQKTSTTIVKDAKVYPNDPCPCGSGKKYKKCCGKN